MMMAENKSRGAHGLWVLNAILSYVPLAAVAISWFFLPDRVPTHFGWSGRVSRWGGKGEWLLAACALTGLFVLISFLLRHGLFANVSESVNASDAEDGGDDSPSLSEQTGRKPQLLILIFIQIVVEAMMIWGIAAVLSRGGTEDIGGSSVVRAVCASIGVILMCLGSAIPLFARTQLIDLHIPWLNAGYEDQRRLRRFTGILAFCCGLVILLLSILLQATPAVTVSTLVLLVIPGIAAILYSRKLSPVTKVTNEIKAAK